MLFPYDLSTGILCVYLYGYARVRVCVCKLLHFFLLYYGGKGLSLLFRHQHVLFNIRSCFINKIHTQKWLEIMNRILTFFFP